VMDGKPGAYTKRGYVIDTGEKLRVAGFRNSSSSVAAFRFSSVRDSYAERRPQRRCHRSRGISRAGHSSRKVDTARTPTPHEREPFSRCFALCHTTTGK
jgi:hypothetical protein